MSLLDPVVDTTTPAQRVAAQIKESIRIAAQMLLSTYNGGYTDLWYSTYLDATTRTSLKVDPLLVIHELGIDAAQVLQLTQIIGQLFGPDALIIIPAGYTLVPQADGSLTANYVEPLASSSSSSQSSSSSTDTKPMGMSSSSSSTPPAYQPPVTTEPPEQQGPQGSSSSSLSSS